ncbi:MAG: class I SAM-dependent methyltransferase [Bacteroidales bacterium]|nr:class I SAM-dependent methyltransferase [Bacteroidales bacterium]
MNNQEFESLKRIFFKNSKEELDNTYKNGLFDYLKSIEELGRYSIIAGYFQYIKKGGSILDIGCGEGLLQNRLGESFSKYIGIDLSKEAIDKAQKQSNDKVEFCVADMNTYSPIEKFDAIVFNEAMYYTSNHLNFLKKYASFLNDGGIFITSNFEVQNNRIHWSEIETVFPKYDETKVVNSKGTTWICKVLMSK